jgi:hypothetical protein
MLVIKTVSGICFVAAIIMGAYMIVTSGSELFNQKMLGRATFICVMPLFFVFGLGALARMFTSRPK